MFPAAHAPDDFWQTLLGRRSLRVYAATPVPRSVLERLLTAAIWAPNAHNRQPWRFAVTHDRVQQQRLAETMAAYWEAALAADGVDADTIARRTTLSYERISGAGALVVGCLTMAEMDAYPDAGRQRLEWLMAVQSTALALGNLLLAAHHEGLGACWMCAPLFAPDRVREAFDLPADWEPQALITLGYPAETRTKERRPLAEVVAWR